MARLKDISPYSAQQWESDRQREDAGETLRCPACERDEWFHCIRRDVPEPNERACKVCGFWQRADGTPAYRCRLTAHVCLGPRQAGGECPECREAIDSPFWHLCVTILRPEEIGERACERCGTVRTERHVIPWVVETGDSGDTTDWWSVIDVDRLKALWKRWS